MTIQDTLKQFKQVLQQYHDGERITYADLWDLLNETNLLGYLEMGNGEDIPHCDTNASLFAGNDIVTVDISVSGCIIIATTDKTSVRLYYRLPKSIAVVNPAASTKYHGKPNIYYIMNEKAEGELTLADLFDVVPDDDVVHTTVGMYPNGPYKVNGVPTKNLLSHIKYNLTLRPGRALYINGVLIYDGLSVGIEQVQALEDDLLYNNFQWRTKDSQPYH